MRLSWRGGEALVPGPFKLRIFEEEFSCCHLSPLLNSPRLD